MIPWLRRPAVPDGVRAYAVAPLSGRLAALDDAIARIAADCAGRPVAERRIVLLGGLVDGPDAAMVVLRAMRLAADPGIAVLRGPAEEALLARADPDQFPATMLHWLSRRPAQGWIGDYRFGDGRITAGRRVIAGGIVGLEGRRRWTL